MIKTRQDLIQYLEEDKKALGIKENFSFKLKQLIFPDRIYHFQKTLRYTEYYFNRSIEGSYQYKILSLIYRLSLRKKSLRLGFSIPLNAFGPGLSIAHYGTIVVNSATKVGKNCRLHVCVNIGASAGSKKAPKIGDNVYIAPGCKIFGDIEIADNITISANSVVNKSFLQPNVLIGGVPAKILKDYGNDEIFNWK